MLARSHRCPESHRSRFRFLGASPPVSRRTAAPHHASPPAYRRIWRHARLRCMGCHFTDIAFSFIASTRPAISRALCGEYRRAPDATRTPSACRAFLTNSLLREIEPSASRLSLSRFLLAARHRGISLRFRGAACAALYAATCLLLLFVMIFPAIRVLSGETDDCCQIRFLFTPALAFPQADARPRWALGATHTFI